MARTWWWDDPVRQAKGMEALLESVKLAASAAGLKEKPAILGNYPEAGLSAVSFYDGGLNIFPALVKAKSIKGSIDVPGWAVDAAVPVPGSYDVPDDVDIVDLGQFQNRVDAIITAVTYIVEQNVRNVLYDEPDTH
jgi:hypothetical protein